MSYEGYEADRKVHQDHFDARAEVDPVLIRNMVPGDEPYVFSTWLRDLRDADGGPLPDDVWFPAHREMIKTILADPTTVVKVACASDKPEEILGYAVARPQEVLFWVQVRKTKAPLPPLRGRGLAKRLLAAVEAPPGTSAAWATPDSRDRLKNPPRGRRVRRLLARASQSTARSSASSEP